VTLGVDPHQPGDTVLTQISGAVGKAIEFGQWLNGDGFIVYEHAAMYLGGGMVVEAEPGGARVAQLSEYDGRAQFWSTGHIALSTNQRADIVLAAKRYADTRVPYSFLDYDALATHRLHIPVPGLKKYIADTGHMICSQLVDQCYLDAGVHLFSDGRWPGYVTPGDLHKLWKLEGA
jgi:uncharacterized protein YycO